MEIEVTYLYGLDCALFSDSVARSGMSDIGAITWRAALAEAQARPLCSQAQQRDLRAWLGDFGAWDEQEIDRMSDAETNALLLQFVAGDMQILQGDEATDQTRLSVCAGRIFFYVGV